MALYRTPAIVLRTYPFSDTHLIVVLLSPTYGKIRAIAKGSRRMQSALRSAVQPMLYAIFQFAEGKNLDAITQGVVKNAFPKVRANLEQLSHGLYALELIDRLMEEPEPQVNIFFNLLKTLEGLESGVSASSLLRVFEAQLFKHLGYAPQLEECVHCNTAASLSRFSIRLGGSLCSACQDQDKQAVPVSIDVLNALRACFSYPPGEAPQLSLLAAESVKGIFQRFLEENWSKKIHSHDFLEAIRVEK